MATLVGKHFASCPPEKQNKTKTNKILVQCKLIHSCYVISILMTLILDHAAFA